MKKIFYEKVGRRYVPVSEYDNELLDAFPKGNHLVSVYPGGSSRRFRIDPAFAPMIAAGRYAQDAMHKAINNAAKMHREEHENTILTNEQHEAWQKFVDVMGERGRFVKYKSVHDIAEAGINAMQEEADKLMTNPVVRKAYERFLMVVELTRERQHE
jgi:hypothetical protein